MKIKFVSLLTLLIILATGCKDKPKESEMETEVEAAEETTATPITIEKLEGSPAYADAALTITKPTTETVKLTEGGIDFAFDVKNYELGAQTDSEITGNLANSAKGQHIHFIVDNDPYSAHYEPTFKKELEEGTHFLIAFLSRSYHESLKNPNAFVAEKVIVGQESADAPDVDFSKPTLIYSRPKGTYSGVDTKNLLLDFYLLNTSLSKGGNYVKATINGVEFELTEWVPYVVKGLPKGAISIKLELLDKDGNGIPGDFNTVERTVTLE
ncbi:hypothetical protein DSM03_11514 [Leeuwenhoekiella aestuarii]|uniref:Phosphopeptide-binding protein n=1 Tax=Leeuwenhoekiella aestuarii TaxID=2249426 RepID=A0A4Q0NQB2_9FLAO|nr:hypothetical protein [Leeuwenhoekiella aestuarii]RXG11220.1 hypothetical protein DSM04_11314 [Leeuwenhoekiella aestuarii]RXG11586.1 hypothetical protein DSM03_11514 [Leeuwenhoekiella aestuarii]